MSDSKLLSSKPEFRADIEGLRALAILLVLVYHAQIPWFRGGFIGVDVFFVLSGFLITRSLLYEAETSGAIRLREFYARRVRRLLPGSALVLAATGAGVLLALPSSMWRTFGSDILAAGTYVVNWRFASRAVDYLAQDVLPSPVQHFWSLSVEEQFYFIWPALIIGGLSLACRRRFQLRRTIAIVLIGLVLIPSLTWSSLMGDSARAFFVTTTRMWELSAGALVAVLGTGSIRNSSTRTFVKVAGLLLVIGASVAVDGSVPWPGVAALLPIVGTVLVISGAGGHDVVERILTTTPMRKVGAWSYSLYLWHWPMLAILSARWGGLAVWQAILITLGSFVPAVAAYNWVETPVRFRPSLKASPGLTMAIGASLTFVTVVVGLGVALAAPTRAVAVIGDSSFLGAKAITPDVDAEGLLRQVEETVLVRPSPSTATLDRPTLYDEGCQVGQTDSEPIICERGDPNGALLVMLLGDSKVVQWEPALDVIGRRHGWRILTITKSACELTTSTPDKDDEPYPSCQEWNSKVLDLVDERRPNLILVSQGSSTAWNEETSANDRGLMVDGMLGAYGRVVVGGTELVIMLDNPDPGFVVRDCVAANPEDLATCAFSLERKDETGGRSVQREVAELGSYPLLDLTDMMCPYGTCFPVIGGVLVYRDGSHITATYVESMTDTIEQRLFGLLPTLPSNSKLDRALNS